MTGVFNIHFTEKSEAVKDLPKVTQLVKMGEGMLKISM